MPESPVALARVAEVVASIRASVEVAHINPRDEHHIEQRVKAAMSRPRAADQATYCFPRGGKDVIGPSVKLARELARIWGNIQTGLSIVSCDDDMVHIEGWAWDLQSNVRTAREAKFKKLIQRGKKWIQPDERDLDELIARRGAKLTRNATLELIPDFLIDEALDQSQQTLREDVSAKMVDGPEEQIRKACEAFDQWDVPAEQLLEYIGGEWSSDGIATLRQVHKSISDGHSRVEEYFTSRPKEVAAGEAPQTLDDLKGGSF